MLIALILSILTAHAASLDNQTCKLSGEIILSAPLDIVCMKNLKIADGTRIYTQGYPVQIMAIGNIEFGNVAEKERPPRLPGLYIISFRDPAPQSRAAGPIYIYANTAFGNLDISNFGAGEKDLSGEIAIEYIARGKGYTQKFRVSAGTRVDLLLNGYHVDSSKFVVVGKTPPAAAVKAAEPAPVQPRKKHIPRVRREPRRPPPPQLPPRAPWYFDFD